MQELNESLSKANSSVDVSASRCHQLGAECQRLQAELAQHHSDRQKLCAQMQQVSLKCKTDGEVTTAMLLSLFFDMADIVPKITCYVSGVR